MRLKALMAAAAASVVLAACGGTTDAPASDEGGTGEEIRFAMILPGPVSDADYNAAGKQAVDAIAESLGAEATFSENVAVVDAERVARDYLARGFDTIDFHGAQYTSIAAGLAPQFPDQQFIVEGAGEVPDLPPNVYTLARTYVPGFYIIGQLAAEASETGVVGYVAGLKIPDFIGGLNAVYEGAKSVRSDIKVVYSFTGDQNDAVKGRQATQALIDQKADVMVITLAGGLSGAVEAIRQAPSKVLFTGLHTDKTSLAPENFLASMLFDYAKSFPEALEQIAQGEANGYMLMTPENGGVKFTEASNVSDEAAATFADAVKKAEAGSLDMPEIDPMNVDVP
jgi:basic membrane protein A